MDQSGFISLCRQVEMAGGVEIGKGPGKLAKVSFYKRKLLYDFFLNFSDYSAVG